MLSVTFGGTGTDGPAWDRGLRVWWERAEAVPRRVVLITPRLELGGGEAGEGVPPPSRLLLEAPWVAPEALLVLGPDRGPEGQATAYGSWLDRGLDVVPSLVLESRDGLPAVRRALAGRPGGEIALILDAAAAGREALAGAAVGVARTVCDPSRNGGSRLAALAVLGWPEEGRASGGSRRDLVARILQIALAAV